MMKKDKHTKSLVANLSFKICWNSWNMVFAKIVVLDCIMLNAVCLEREQNEKRRKFEKLRSSILIPYPFVCISWQKQVMIDQALDWWLLLCSTCKKIRYAHNVQTSVAVFSYMILTMSIFHCCQKISMCFPLFCW